MNMKVLASLGVVVAFLTAWLLVSLYSVSTVTIEPSSDAPEEVLSRGHNEGAVLGGEDFGVKTSVNVANQDVITTVQVAE
jgi:hypothetical protein